MHIYFPTNAKKIHEPGFRVQLLKRQILSENE